MFCDILGRVKYSGRELPKNSIPYSTKAVNASIPILLDFGIVQINTLGGESTKYPPLMKPQEKKGSLVLKLKVYDLRVFTGHTRRCITRAAFFLKNVPGTFFNATHQVKAIAIGVSEVNPLGESVDCSSPLHSTRVLNQFIGLYFKRDTPLYPLLYSSLFPFSL